MRMRKVVMLGCVAALAACKPANEAGNDAVNAQFAADVNAIDAETRNIMAAGAEPPPPPYVAGPDDAKGANEVTDAMPGELHYRDLPAARLFRGDWTVEKTEWFAVGGSDTPPRSPAKMALLAGAHVRIDRQLIEVTPKTDEGARISLRCPGVSYIGKDALIASAHQPTRADYDITREDMLRDYSIAVAEKEIVQRLPGRSSADGEVVHIYCSEARGFEGDQTGWGDFSGALLLDRNHMVLLYSDGTALFMKRDAQ